MIAPARPSDTSPTAFAAQISRFRQMTPAERAALVTDLTQAASAFALAGLRTRHPHASPQELMLRLAVLRLGATTVYEAYGWREPDGA